MADWGVEEKKSKNANENHPKQKTRDKLPLTLGENNQPLLIDSPGEGHHIPGQVYVIDEKGIEILDAFESQLGVAKSILSLSFEKSSKNHNSIFATLETS